MKSRNPVLPPEYYFPDGEPHVINGELYVYPSCDLIPGCYCSDRLYVAHSKDLTDWTIEGPVFSCSQLDWPPAVSYPPGLIEARNYQELPGYLHAMLPRNIHHFLPFGLFKAIVKKVSIRRREQRLLYAPDAITVNGKSYLFFCTSDGCEGMAAADEPAGPFRNPVRITGDRSGKPITGIDPAVFRDDDGKIYLYWGQINACGAELSDDMTKIKEDTLVCGLLTEKDHGFHEGSSMRKIGSTYYYVFADIHRGKPSALSYATSRNPLGPFTYQGVIIDNDGCDSESWNNHGGIECVNGQWYVFYHRSTGNSRYQRRMCAEPITINENGQIVEVRPTSMGMGDPYRIGETLYAYQVCRVTKNAWITGERLIVEEGLSEVTFRYLDQGARDISYVSYEGTGIAIIRHRIDAEGELTLSIEASERTEILSFQLHPKTAGEQESS